jgi:hypothetical protein
MRIFTGILALAAFAGCAGGRQQTRLEAVEFQKRPLQSGTALPLESGGDELGTVEVATGGAFATTLGKHRERVIHVRLTVRNGDAGPFRIPLDQLAVEGVGADRLRPLAIFGDRPENATSITVPPGDARAIDVVFALPTGWDPADVGAFQVHWGVDLPADLVRKATAFAPVDLPEEGVARAFRPTDGANLR